MHRAKIAQPRVRMEGWRQRRPGSNAKESTGRKEKTERKNILTRKKNILDTHRPSHGRRLARVVIIVDRTLELRGRRRATALRSSDLKKRFLSLLGETLREEGFAFTRDPFYGISFIRER